MHRSCRVQAEELRERSILERRMEAWGTGIDVEDFTYRASYLVSVQAERDADILFLWAGSRGLSGSLQNLRPSDVHTPDTDNRNMDLVYAWSRPCRRTANPATLSKVCRQSIR